MGIALIFFSEKARKNTKTTRIADPCPMSRILGKEGKNFQKSREFLEKRKARKSKEIGREDQGVPSTQGCNLRS